MINIGTENNFFLSMFYVPRTFIRCSSAKLYLSSKNTYVLNPNYICYLGQPCSITRNLESINSFTISLVTSKQSHRHKFYLSS